MIELTADEVERFTQFFVEREGKDPLDLLAEQQKRIDQKQYAENLGEFAWGLLNPRGRDLAFTEAGELILERLRGDGWERRGTTDTDQWKHWREVPDNVVYKSSRDPFDRWKNVNGKRLTASWAAAAWIRSGHNEAQMDQMAPFVRAV